MYKALVLFHDLQDERYEYKAGDTYPRQGLNPSEERIQELMSSDNRRGKPLIKEVSKRKKKNDK